MGQFFSWKISSQIVKSLVDHKDSRRSRSTRQKTGARDPRRGKLVEVEDRHTMMEINRGYLNVESYLQTWERCSDMCHLINGS